MPKSLDRDAEEARLLIAGRLVRAIAHNLRQPLMALEMNLAIILKLTKRTPLDTALIGDAIEDAWHAERTMAVSLQALEDLATPRRRRDEPIDVAGIVLEIAQLVGLNTKPSSVRIEAETEGGVPALVGDPAMVREAILSLVLSAVDRLLTTTPSSTRGQTADLPVVIIARREQSGHVAIVVEHTAVPGEDNLFNDESSWDTSIAQVALTLHDGSLSIEHDAATSRAITRWPVHDT